MPQTNPFLLPTHIEPTHYEIELRPQIKSFTFSGSETISINIHRATSTVELHSLDLQIETAEILLLPEETTLKARKIRSNARRETITLEFPKRLRKGAAELLLKFSGELNDKMQGFYRTSYKVGNQKHWGAATQFEATDARRAFPCWDEPAVKATFKVALTVPGNMTVLSNMPEQSETDAGRGWRRIQYDTTPRMSTYLLAFVVAELECIEGRDANRVPIRVWTSPGKKEQGQFALEQAIHTLAYFASWFGIPYAFPKLDMVALPDFASGAMENWGLVTYRETALLVDPVNSAPSARQRVAEVVDHELAHQWFGNYTTMNWWTDLWLNEGFASYMGPKATDQSHPAWEIWTQYVYMDYLAALHEDSLKNTHPVEVPVKNPSEIREVFDAISYSKGSVVNRMVEHYLGEEDFRKGLNHYLTRFAYGNASTVDLWQALEEVSGKPIKKMMVGYTRQPGYPVLTVKSKMKKGKMQLDLEQSRFLVDGSRDRKKLKWQIPVGVQVGHQAEPVYSTMTGSKLRISLDVENDTWVKINPGQSGFYRVAYPEDLWDRLVSGIRDQQVPIIDRLGLLDDAFALARAGYWKTSSAMRMLEAYRSEQDYSVWLAIAGVWATQNNQLAREKCHPKVIAAAREMFAPLGSEMGWEKRPQDGHPQMLLRALAIRHLGGYGDPETIDEARNRLKHFLKKGELDPNLRMGVFTLVAENGDAQDWEDLKKIYRKTDLQEERTRVLRAAGHFHDKAVIQEVLEFALSEQVRFQDTWIVLASAGTHPLGRTLAWRFLKKNWKTFLERYHGGGLNLLTRLISISSGFATRAEMQDAEKFLRAHRAPGIERAVNKSLERIRSNVRWVERDRKDLQQYFS